MTKSEIVEALRCAADLCSKTIAPVRAACFMRDVSLIHVVTALECALDRPRRSDNIENLRHDLLEAAQRIEESEWQEA